MLVFTRKQGESIMIGDNIEVTITEVKGGKARIGIEAPRDIPVHRKEVYEQIQKEKNGERPGPCEQCIT